MSSVYATEPATTGRVIIETSHGPLDIHLWSRECPATTRLFLQLCLDGFYDNCLFHRIVPSLLIQTGAIRAQDQQQQKSISSQDDAMMKEYRQAVSAEEALLRRPYETNARIRFNHRGQVAMALTVQDDNDVELLQPQFFITTEAADYLDGQHVIFGTLAAGPTIFNAIRISTATAVDETTHAPLELQDAPRIRSVKIVDNPIHDTLVPTVKVQLPWRQQEDHSKTKRKKKRKGKLDVNVLSFGDEMGDVVAKSSSTVTKSGKQQQQHQQPKQSTSAAAAATGEFTEERSRILRDEEKQEAKPAYVAKAQQQSSVESVRPSSSTNSNSYKPEPPIQNEAPAPPAVSTSKNITSKNNKKESVSLVEARRSKFTKQKKSKQQREEDTLARLAAFQGKVQGATQTKATGSDTADNGLAARMARRAAADNNTNNDNEPETYHGQILDDKVDDGGDGWMRTKFQCRKHMDHTAGADGRNMDGYKVIDESNNNNNNNKRSRGDEMEERHNDHRQHQQQHKKHKKHHRQHHHGDNNRKEHRRSKHE